MKGDIKKIAEIALPVPIRKSFSYFLTSDEEQENLIGRRVRVEFGKRILCGVIVGFKESQEEIELKSIIDIIDDSPVYTENLLKLTKWISDYYFCSWGETLKAALPTTYGVNKQINQIKKLSLDDKFISNPQDLISEIDSIKPRFPKQALILEFLQEQLKNKILSVVLSDIPSEIKSDSAIKSLIKKELVSFVFEDKTYLEKTELNNLSTTNEALLKLTTEQEAVKIRIIEAFAEQSQKPFLLHGVTGSGKTLIYIQIIKEILKQNKSVLILVPEISLTPQLIDRFREALDEKIAALHSRISDEERYLAWQSIKSGEIRIVIGARSSLFAPLNDLGLIIVDEEHEPTYKQVSPAPRYNARDSAIVRAKIENAVIVLGSATPSLESMENAKSGKFELLEITKRADGALMPEIIDVNTLDARKFGQMNGSASKKLLDEITDKLQKKEGVIIFQNRRGYSVSLECSECGNVPVCSNCDVSLTYHKKINTLKCHYCGFSTKYHSNCNVCGNPDWTELGSGTQKIEEELSAYFQSIGVNAKIERMDLDTTSKANSHRKILKSFADREIDILVGTQMVAKGLDFPHVSLVGVINADNQLYLPDFRASERTYQLLTQVAGRAGRSSGIPGKVIIQTAHPDNHSVYASRIGSYDYFYIEEMKHRKSAFYPPFCRFVLLEFSGKNETNVAESALNFFRNIKRHSSITILGPVQPNIQRLNNEFRRLLIIKNDKKQDKNGVILRNILDLIVEKDQKKWKKSDVKLIIDIDSMSSI